VEVDPETVCFLGSAEVTFNVVWVHLKKAPSFWHVPVSQLVWLPPPENTLEMGVVLTAVQVAAPPSLQLFVLIEQSEAPQLVEVINPITPAKITLRDICSPFECSTSGQMVPPTSLPYNFLIVLQS
jgi:hypothetical protein